MAVREFVFVLLFAQFALSNGLDCYGCDSRTDDNCATLRLNTTAIECNDKCAIWIDGQNTFRGCDADIPSTVSLQHTCEVNGCNQIIFPIDRIKCVKCSADEEFCLTPNADRLYPCKNYVRKDACYTYVIDDKSVIRGCISDRDENVDLCKSVGDDCIECSEEFCNLQGGHDYVSCVECSSVDDPSCGYTQKDVPEEGELLCEVLLGRENLCFAFTNRTHFQRGCLNDFPELKTVCAENNENCQICDEDSCNSMKLIDEFCVVCDSSSDPGCRDIESTHTPALCGEATISESGCYLSDKDGEVRRGCVASLEPDRLRECLDGETCKICHGDGCNSKPTFQKCYACNSAEDPNCATLQGELHMKTCDDYYDTCKVYVKPIMTTHRGCFKEMLDEEIECLPETVNCDQCSENGCNGEIFPGNRISCYHCKGENRTTDCYKNLVENPELSYPCETYNFRDSCYMYIDVNKTIHRGCLSDQDEYSGLCQSDSAKCQTCQSTNCNVESVLKEPEMSCISCDTGYNGDECNWGYKASLGEKCFLMVYFYDVESCYRITTTDQTIRGCTLDTNVCRTSSRCTLCTEPDVCNRANTAQQLCNECSSDENSNCGPKPSQAQNVTCPGIIEFEHRGCFTWVNADGIVKRGCYSDLTADDITKCLADEENCERCVDEEYCNSMPKGSAGFIAVNLMLLFSMFALAHSI